MTRTARTPGPWTYDYSPYSSQAGEEIPAYEVHGDYKVCDTNENRPREEQEAIAMLIAAAPDLLEAALLVLDHWSSGDLAGAIRMLDAAVARAGASAPMAIPGGDLELDRQVD